MSSLIEAKLEEIGELVRAAEGEMLTLKFDNEQLRKDAEEMRRELAQAVIRIEELEGRLEQSRGGDSHG
jgi:hypothetical protein